FTSFVEYGRYYNNIIAWMNIYMKNDTITGNSRFIKVTEEIEQEEWYKSADEKNGGAIWRFCRIPSDDHKALAVLRMLKTKKGENVGILGVYIRPERFKTLLQDRNCDTFVILNGEAVIAETGADIKAEQALAVLPEKTSGQAWQNIFLDQQEYVMTCETISLTESQDYLQIVSFKAYRDILRDVNRQTAKSIGLFALSVALSVSIILVFAHLFSRRVERFREQMQKAAGGDFDLRENFGGKDEISDLYDYLGTMIYQIQRLLAEIYQEKLHAERLTIQQKDAEFKMLASQINPHFLYNTLEMIRMKARKSRQHDIEEIVRMLARIMRSTLQAGASEITIGAEVELAEYYLKIQQYRFGERIQYHIQVEDGLSRLPILPLILQPIVENSIIHGLECKEGAGRIDIHIRSREDMVTMTVTDDGQGMNREELKELRRKLNSYNVNGQHIGVSNVHQRVKLKYGDAYGVTVDSVEGIYTQVEILLPPAAMLKGDTYVQGNDN
ncbi:MAG: sensor histidine kinase, partial [Acetatifactor sp.]|nr:sensor histidine kinase [Acetatifactor sp.]